MDSRARAAWRFTSPAPSPPTCWPPFTAPATSSDRCTRSRPWRTPGPGEPGALTAARRIVAALGGTPLVIPPALRPLYHSAAVFASNYVLVAAAVVARTLAEAGIEEKDAVAAALPLMRGTIDNLEQLGLGSALTGPVSRGDIDTVRLHLSRLSPRERRLYSALGLETLQLARAVGLDPARADALESLLAD